MLVELIDEKDRPRRFTLRELLFFDVKFDGILLLLTLLPFLGCWFYGPPKVRLNSLYRTNGAVHNVMMRDVMFDNLDADAIPYLNRQDYTTANIFPLYPLLLTIPTRLLSIDAHVALRLFSLILSSIANLLFYRLCLVHRFVSYPFLTACLFTMYPQRCFLLRQIANEYSLFLIFLCGIFIGKRIHQKILCTVSIFFIVLTSELGIWVSIGLLVHTLITRNRIEFRNMLVPFTAAFLLLIGFQKVYAHSFFAYFRNLLAFRQYPLKPLFINAMHIDKLRNFHGLYGYFIIPMISSSMLIVIDSSIGIPIVLALLWATARPGDSTFDLAAPIDAFSTLLAFDVLIRSRRFQWCLIPFVVVYEYCMIRLTCLILGNQALYVR
jgi:hypothetical protein